MANDATGVEDERRSPKRVEFAECRFVAVENGIRDLEFPGKLASLLDFWMHGNHEDLKSLAGIAFVKLLEMNHLLAGERSVA